MGIWRCITAVKDSGCFSKSPRFECQHPRCRSKPHVIPLPWEFNSFFWIHLQLLCGMQDKQSQNISIHSKLNIKLKVLCIELVEGNG